MSDKEAFFIRACVPDIKQVEGLPEDVPAIWVRSMTVGQQARVGKVSKAAKANDNDLVLIADLQTDIILWCACHSDGKRYFADTDRKQVEELHADISQTIADAAIDVSDTGDEDSNKTEDAEGDAGDSGN